MKKKAGLPLALLLSALPLVLRAADETTAPTPPAPAATPAPAPAPVIAPAPAPVNAPLPDVPLSSDKLSTETSQRMTSILPKYSPPLPEKPAAAPNPDMIELPKVTVTQKKRPRLGNDVMMTTAAFNEQLAKEKLGSFDRDFLNKYTLPSWFGGQSAADRAREDYNREKKQQLVNDVQAISKAVDQIDPAQAKSLRDDAAKP